MNWYIAAPFFNTAQIELVERIEVRFEKAKVPGFFSPRKTDTNQKKELTDVDARRIFDRNNDEMLMCDNVLVVLDWKMPVGLEIWPCEVERQDGTLAKVGRTPLNIPDTGTVWEAGFIYGLNFRSKGGQIPKNIYGFTERPKGDKVNIMLTQCLDGVIYGLEDLEKFLAGDSSVVTRGEWRHR